MPSRLLGHVLCIAAVALVLTGTAGAHLAYRPAGEGLRHTERSQARNLAHANYVCQHGARAHKRWACKARSWLGRELAQTRAALVPPIAHRSLWLCIHSREGAWDDGGWPYWGGLQMGAWFLSTYLPAYADPEGHTGPGGWLNGPSAEEQMAAAERGYRQSGYSRAWLYGQWPNTAPPCS